MPYPSAQHCHTVITGGHATWPRLALMVYARRQSRLLTRTERSTAEHRDSPQRFPEEGEPPGPFASVHIPFDQQTPPRTQYTFTKHV